MTSPDRTLASRHELKFWLAPEHIMQVRQAIRPFVRPDRFAARQPGYRYVVSSLYLDSPGLDCYRTTIEGHRNRFKLRIRSYTDDPADPVFCEIKSRSNQVVRKRRASVDRRFVESFLKGRSSTGGVTSSLAEFMQLSRRLDAGPTLRVRYEREAYESTGRDPVRITFDTQLHHNAARRQSLSLTGSGWAPTPTEGAILEVKFTDNCPSWATRMVQSLSLERTSVPKYILCVDEARERGTLLPGLPVFEK